MSEGKEQQKPAETPWTSVATAESSREALKAFAQMTEEELEALARNVAPEVEKSLRERRGTFEVTVNLEDLLQPLGA